MNHEEYVFLASEINELESILSEIPADRVIDRRSFETRLNKAKNALSQMNPAQLLKSPTELSDPEKDLPDPQKI